MSSSPSGRATPRSRFAPVNDGDERVGRLRDELVAASPSCRSLPSTITPTCSASAAASSKSCVTRIVGSENSRSSSCSSARIVVFVCASSDDSGSSRSRTPGSRASARASATRWRSPPESSSGARRRGARSGNARVSSTRPTPPIRDVAAHAHVRKERVLLEDEADPARVRATGRCAASASNQASSPSAIRPAAGARAPRSPRSTEDLPPPKARRARRSAPTRSASSSSKRAKREGELALRARPQGCQFQESRIAAVMITSSALIVTATLKSGRTRRRSRAAASA